MTERDPFDFTDTDLPWLSSKGTSPRLHETGASSRQSGGDPLSGISSTPSPPLDDRPLGSRARYGSGSGRRGIFASATELLDPATSESIQVAPPVRWLLAALVAAVVALAIGVVQLSGPIHVAAWAVAGPIAIGLLTVYSARDSVQQASAYYGARAELRAAYWACFSLSMAAVLLNAWRIASWAGRL